MKIMMISKFGDGADVLFRMALDGHSVCLYIDQKEYSENFSGIVRKTDDWRREINKCDLVIFDDNKLSSIWEQVHRQVPCFGGSTFGARLEEDRAFAHAMMAKAGIERVESLTFKSLREVIPHLKEHHVPHVVKPSGKKVDSHHVLIGRDADNGDLIAQVERLIEQGLPHDAVEVEEKKTGVEVGLGFLFNGHAPVGPIEVNFEHKHSHEGERGYLTGETGTLMRYAEDPALPLYEETLKKMVPILRAADFRGELDINLIVGEDDDGRFVAPLEFTPRLGKPAAFLQDELRVTPWADYLGACARGEDCALQVRYDWGVAVVLNGFGFPFEDQHVKCSKGLPVAGVDERSLAHLHPMQLRLDKRGKFVTGHGEGYLLVATGRGAEIAQAKDAAYAALEQVHVPNAFYRGDISDKIHPSHLDAVGVLPLAEGSAR